jgi:glucose-1-phosphate adenylyltransferase
MTTLGLIFSNIHNKEVFEVTQSRTIASTPIGGRYRLIDFTLSNMVNNGITNIGVVTKNNYQSLMDHVGSGKDWDLARKNGGLVILPPYGASPDAYNTRLEALKSIINYINRTKADYVLLTDCYYVCNIDYKKVFEFHHKTNADITCVYREAVVTNEDIMPINIFEVNEDNQITEMTILKEFNGPAKVSLDTWVLKKSLLQDLILDAINRNLRSFNRDILKENLNNLKIFGYKFDGYCRPISSLNSYYNMNMDLLNKDIRDELFSQEGRRIYTKVRDSSPTKYGENAVVKNSLIADGCYIDGHVENSILFRGTKINKNAVIKDSILMQDTIVNEDIIIDHVITDKNVKILHKKEIIGTPYNLSYVKKDGVL